MRSAGSTVSRPVFVESESRRIGSVQMPDALLAQMRAGRALTLVTPIAQRVALLKDEYAHFLAAPAQLGACLQPLTELHGKATIARWQAMASAGDWDGLVAALLEAHYDPMYARSLERNFPSARRCARGRGERPFHRRRLQRSPARCAPTLDCVRAEVTS